MNVLPIVIPIVISGLLLLFAVLTFAFARGAAHDSQTKNNVELNVKLDQCVNNTNSILIKQEKQESKIQQMDTKIAVIDRDLKTAFNQIDEIKEAIK